MQHPDPSAPSPAAGHWDTVYRDRGPTHVSWFQATPQPSADLICDLAPDRTTSVIDIGGGSSPLAAHLIQAGFTDVTVLDVSAEALQIAEKAATALLGPAVDAITWIRADLLTWRPQRAWQIWHDRAVFHFLTDPTDRSAYLTILHTALPTGGSIVLGTFAPSGPAHCSGLPVTRYSPDDLVAELTTVFGDQVTVTGTRHQNHYTPSGTTQPFTWITAHLR